MAGVVHVLPHLGGKDGLGDYACTVLTADDRDDKTIDPPQSLYFRLVMLYTQCDSTAFRSYSSEEGSWSEEAKLTNARLGRKQMGFGLTVDGFTHGVVGRGGRLVYWLSNNMVFVLCLEKLQLQMVINMPWSGKGWNFDMLNTLSGLSPNGMLCAIQLSRTPHVPWAS